MSEFIPTLIGAAAVLLGIWLKARIDRAVERQSVAAVAYAELAELMRQLHVGAELFHGISRFVDQDKLREMREHGGTTETDPKIERQLKRARRYAQTVQEYSKEFGARSLLHTSPDAIGRLGPHLAYLVRTMYARIEALVFRTAALLTTAVDDADSALDFLAELDSYQKEIDPLNQVWEDTRPVLIRAAGGQVEALVRRRLGSSV